MPIQPSTRPVTQDGHQVLLFFDNLRETESSFWRLFWHPERNTSVKVVEQFVYKEEPQKSSPRDRRSPVRKWLLYCHYQMFCKVSHDHLESLLVASGVIFVTLLDTSWHANDLFLVLNMCIRNEVQQKDDKTSCGTD